LDIVTVRLRPMTHRHIYHYHKNTIEERLAFLDPEWRKGWRV